MLPKVIGRRYKKFMQSTDIPYRNLHVCKFTCEKMVRHRKTYKAF